MERAARLGARHLVRRSLRRALLLAGGTVGGTLVCWAVAAGSAHATTHSAATPITAAPITAVDQAAAPIVGPVLDAPSGTLDQLTTAPDSAAQTPSPDTSPLALAPNLLADPTRLPATMRDQLTAPNGSLRSTTDGVLHTLTPASRTVRHVAGTLTAATPIRLDTAPGALLSTLGQPLAEDAPHSASPKHPVHDEPAPASAQQLPSAAPAAPQSAQPSDLVPGARQADWSVATGARAPNHHHAATPTVPAGGTPFGPFAPAPAAPLPASATGSAFVPAGGGPGAVQQQHDRDTEWLAITLPAPGGVDHRIGTPAQQPGVTPD